MNVAEYNEVGIVGVVDDYKDETVKRLLAKNSNKATGYLTPKARLRFTKLMKAFTKVPILQHFNPECYIQMETDASGYDISGVLSQLILDNLGQWHPIAFYSQKMIPLETRYKTYEGKLLVIIKAFKT